MTPPVQHGAQCLPGLLQPSCYGGLRNAKRLRNFAYVHILPVVQQDHLFQLWGKLHDIPQDVQVLLLGQRHGLRDVLRRDAPIVMPEPCGALHALAGVDGNTDQPCFDAAFTPEGIQVAIGLQEGFLNRIPGQLLIPKIYVAHVQQHFLIFVDQLGKALVLVLGRIRHLLLTSLPR